MVDALRDGPDLDAIDVDETERSSYCWSRAFRRSSRWREDSSPRPREKFSPFLDRPRSVAEISDAQTPAVRREIERWVRPEGRRFVVTSVRGLRTAPTRPSGRSPRARRRTGGSRCASGRRGPPSDPDPLPRPRPVPPRIARRASPCSPFAWRDGREAARLRRSLATAPGYGGDA
jgi:hypothetical protein